MDELDMRPGSELFPEAKSNNYNSYQDVNVDQVVGDPLNTGVSSNASDVADQGSQVSDKEFNFRALREETAKLKEEREYWKGQAEAYSRQPVRDVYKPEATQQDAMTAIDWEDTTAVKTAWEQLRQENQQFRSEMKDYLAAVETKTQHNDWNNMVTQHVPQLTNKNPIFAEMIKNSSNPYEAAYLLAELNAKASQPQAAAPQSTNYGQRAMANAQKPQTLASVGGHGQLSAADYYANMSDDDFMKIASRNLANI
jgi:hypothetical protein